MHSADRPIDDAGLIGAEPVKNERVHPFSHRTASPMIDSWVLSIGTAAPVAQEMRRFKDLARERRMAGSSVTI
jgi:hypothetical protein